MRRYFITMIILIIATIANYTFSAPKAALIRRPLSEFPNILGNWTAVNEQHIDEGSMAVLLVDDYIMRTYANKKGETINLYIGYFKTQREGKQVHSPRQCLSGTGWNTIEHRKYLLTLPGHNPEELPINLQVMAKGSEKQLYLWWYQGRGRIYANEYLNKVYLIWDAMTKGRTDGALVRANMPINSNIAETLKSEITFIDLFVSLLPRYIPH